VEEGGDGSEAAHRRRPGALGLERGGGGGEPELGAARGCVVEWRERLPVVTRGSLLFSIKYLHFSVTRIKV
jgi:hypothetical protein